MEFNKIIKQKELVDNWPGEQNAYKCIVSNSGTETEKIIPKSECEMLMFIDKLSDKLNKTEIDMLKILIESYGDERYYEAQIDASMDDAGEDI